MRQRVMKPRNGRMTRFEETTRWLKSDVRQQHVLSQSHFSTSGVATWTVSTHAVGATVGGLNPVHRALFAGYK